MWFPLWIRTDQDACSRVAHVKSCVPTATTDVIHGLAIRTMTGVTVRMTLKINGLTITVIRWIGTLVSMIEADRHVCSTMLNVISCMRVHSTCTYKIQEHCTRVLCIKHLPVVCELHLMPVVDTFLQHECTTVHIMYSRSYLSLSLI